MIYTCIKSLRAQVKFRMENLEWSLNAILMAKSYTIISTKKLTRKIIQSNHDILRTSKPEWLGIK